MKRTRNPSVKDIEAETSLLQILNYYLDPKNTTLQAAYHSFSAEHHRAINERVKALYGVSKENVGAADFFNRRVHLVGFLSDELKERVLGDCLEKDGILYVYPAPDRALYKRVLARHVAMHSFEKTRGVCIRSSLAKKNVQQMQYMIHGAKSYGGLKLIKDKGCSFLYTNLVGEFAVGDDDLVVIGVIDEIIVDDIYDDYTDGSEAGTFTGVSRSGFYVVRGDDKAHTPLKLASRDDIATMLLGKRETLVPQPEQRDDGTSYAAKISFKLTKGTLADGQKFAKQGARQVMDFAKPDALLAEQMAKYRVTAVGSGSAIEYAIPNPAIIKSKNGKDVSENYFLSHTECSLLVTASAWIFGSETIDIPMTKTKFTYAKIGAKFYPAKITITSTNVGDEARVDPIAAANRDLEIADGDDFEAAADAMAEAS